MPEDGCGIVGVKRLARPHLRRKIEMPPPANELEAMYVVV